MIGKSIKVFFYLNKGFVFLFGNWVDILCRNLSLVCSNSAKFNIKIVHLTSYLPALHAKLITLLEFQDFFSHTKQANSFVSSSVYVLMKCMLCQQSDLTENFTGRRKYSFVYSFSQLKKR